MLSSNAFWKTQHALHGKDSNALPASLLVVAGILVTYRHMTQETWEGNQLKTFLALIMIQMLPLVLIELKMPSCSDPMALLARFGPKVLLMHAFVLGVRGWYNIAHDDGVWDLLYFVGACVALHMGFGMRLTLRHVFEHRDVLGLVLLAALTATVEESMSYLAMNPRQRLRHEGLLSVVVPTCNYAEILGFVPAVWMVWRSKTELGPCSAADDVKIQTKAKYFFAFLLAFYFCEDLGSVPSLWARMPLAAAGHAAHFLLVLDFSGFMLAHVYSPEKIKAELMKMKASFGAGCLV